jgi:cyclic pyranopterin phosphate synthase
MSSLAVLPTLPLYDGQRRRVDYLRLSLTDRCNYRCTYCMPAEGIVLAPREDVLSFEEIERLCGCFARLGVHRVRLTGGEPTVRKDIVEITRRVAGVAGIREVMMTTNGHRLAELAAPLRAVGLSRVNVSLDTLVRERFRQIARRDGLAEVLAGIDAAAAAGFAALKINVVALRGFNDGEIGALCRFAWARGAVPRFIEWMPMSDGALYAPGELLPAAEIRALVCAQLGVTLWPAGEASQPGAGPARYWRCEAGEIGIISAMTEHFCDACNRVRLSATGRLFSCLAREDGCDLRAPLRAGAPDEAIEQAIRAALAGKAPGHEFQVSGAGAAKKHMVAIGG